jgi:hypothetical protein
VCTAVWSPHHVQSRALHSELVLSLPGRPSVPHHDSHLSCLSLPNGYSEESIFNSEFAVSKSAQGFEFLHVIFHPPGTSYERNQNCTSGEPVEIPAYAVRLRKSEGYLKALSSFASHTLGRYLPGLYEYGRYR